MSDPNLNHARQALASLKHLVVQDIFMTETARYADVILPASAFPRRPAASPTPTAGCKSAGRRLHHRAKRTGPGNHSAAGAPARVGLGLPPPRDVFAEMRRAMPSIAGITWERLEAAGSVTHPALMRRTRGSLSSSPIVFPRRLARLYSSPHLSAMPTSCRTQATLDTYHRPPAGTLAHRLDDPPRRSARSVEPVPVASLHPEIWPKSASNPEHRYTCDRAAES